MSRVLSKALSLYARARHSVGNSQFIRLADKPLDDYYYAITSIGGFVFKSSGRYRARPLRRSGQLTINSYPGIRAIVKNGTKRSVARPTCYSDTFVSDGIMNARTVSATSAVWRVYISVVYSPIRTYSETNERYSYCFIARTSSRIFSILVRFAKLSAYYYFPLQIGGVRRILSAMFSNRRYSFVGLGRRRDREKTRRKDETPILIDKSEKITLRIRSDNYYYIRRNIDVFSISFLIRLSKVSAYYYYFPLQIGGDGRILSAMFSNRWYSFVVLGRRRNRGKIQIEKNNCIYNDNYAGVSSFNIRVRNVIVYYETYIQI